MTDMFSLDFMTESNITQFKDLVFKSSSTEPYLSSILMSLREMNESVMQENAKLYKPILEAETTSDENKLFGAYFEAFEKVFTKHINKVSEIVSRFVIGIDNLIESNEDLINDDNYISQYEGTLSYTGYNFKNLDDQNYPRFNPLGIYKKEFDYLAKLMQEEGIGASYQTVLKIVASVNNTFNKKASGSQWVVECLHDMLGCDIDLEKSYSENMYSAFRDTERVELTITKKELYGIVEVLKDYEDLKDSAAASAETLINEFQQIAKDIGSMIFRNVDNKLRVNTKTDGIQNRDYRLDTYSMNQLDIFFKSKVNQMSKLCNLYCIALGIKLDAIIDYVKQCVDILSTVKFQSGACNDCEDPESGEEFDTDTEDFEGEDFEPEDDDDDDEDDDDDDEDDDDDDEDDDDEDKEKNRENKDGEADIEYDDFYSDDYSMEDNIEEDDNQDIVSDSEDLDEAAYLFEATLFDIEMIAQQENLIRYIKGQILNEMDTPQTTAGGNGQNGGGQQQQAQTANNQQQQQNSGDNLNNLKKINDNNSSTLTKIINGIVDAFLKLWNKFKDFLFNNANKKIEWLKKNSNSKNVFTKYRED